MQKKMFFLIIDDDQDDHEFFEEALKETGESSEYMMVYNGKEALDALEVNKHIIPDYIFLDLNMPVLNGKDTLKEIKKIPRLTNVPVIIYTTSSYPKDVDELKMLGALHFVIKPSAIEHLSNVLSSIIHKVELPFLLNTENE